MTRFYQNGQPDAQPARVARFALYEVTSDRLKSVEAQSQVLGRMTALPCRRPNSGRKDMKTMKRTRFQKAVTWLISRSAHLSAFVIWVAIKTGRI